MAATTSETLPAASFGTPGTRQLELKPTRSATSASRTSLRAPIQRDLVVLWASTRSSSPYARWCSRSCCASSSSMCFPRSARASAVPAASPGGVGVRDGPGAGRRGPVDHVPGDPGRGDAAGAGVRLHAGDRGQGPGPMSHLARGDLQGDLRGCPGTDLGGDRPAHRVRGARGRRRGAHQSALVAHRDPGPAVVRLHGVPRAVAGDLVRAAQPGPHVRVHRAAHHLPGWHLLPVDAAGTGQGRAPSTGCRSSCSSTRSSTSTTGCGLRSRTPPTCTSTSIYPAIVAFSVIFLALGLRNFRHKVLA